MASIEVAELQIEKKAQSRAIGVKQLTYRAVSFACLVLLWWLASYIISEKLLPSPWTVAQATYQNLAEGKVALHFAATLTRVAGGLALSMVLGISLGVLMGLSRRSEYFLDTWVLVGLMIPSTSYAAVLLISMGINDLAAILAIGIATAPVVAINFWEGVKGTDNRLIEMAIAFDASPSKRLREIILPQLYPYIMGSLRYGLGIVWKVTMVVELLGLTSGVGYMIMYWFTVFRMHQVLSWTLMFAVFAIVVEFVILKKLDRWLLGWREEVSL